MLLSFLVLFLLFFLSYFRFLRDFINKRGNFCVVRWFLIHHFVCHCFFFLEAILLLYPSWCIIVRLMCHKAIRYFFPSQIYLMFPGRKKYPYFFWTVLIFFPQKFTGTFFITFLLKHIFFGLNELSQLPIDHFCLDDIQKKHGFENRRDKFCAQFVYSVSHFFSFSCISTKFATYISV